MNHRISNLFGVEMAGMSAYKFAPVNLTWVIFNFLNRINYHDARKKVTK